MFDFSRDVFIVEQIKNIFTVSWMWVLADNLHTAVELEM